ncbi:MAG: transposase, partial [Thermus sp.]
MKGLKTRSPEPLRIGVQARLVFSSGEDRELVLDLMRRFSSSVRYAYNRLLEGWGRNELKRHLQGVFYLNSRYADDAILKAQATLDSAKERGQNPRKVIFGGRGLFEQLKRKGLLKESRALLRWAWMEKRQGNLYARGDKT